MGAVLRGEVEISFCSILSCMGLMKDRYNTFFQQRNIVMLQMLHFKSIDERKPDLNILHITYSYSNPIKLYQLSVQYSSYYWYHK